MRKSTFCKRRGGLRATLVAHYSLFSLKIAIFSDLAKFGLGY